MRAVLPHWPFIRGGTDRPRSLSSCQHKTSMQSDPLQQLPQVSKYNGSRARRHSALGVQSQETGSVDEQNGNIGLLQEPPREHMFSVLESPKFSSRNQSYGFLNAGTQCETVPNTENQSPAVGFQSAQSATVQQNDFQGFIHCLERPRKSTHPPTIPSNRYPRYTLFLE